MEDAHQLDLMDSQLRQLIVEEQQQLPTMLLTAVMQELQLQERLP